MINFIFAYVIQSNHFGFVPRWVTSLLASKSAQLSLVKSSKSLRNSANASARIESKAGRLGHGDGTLTFFKQDFGPAIDVATKALNLVDVGNIESAYSLVSSFRYTNASISWYNDLLAMDCELLSGRYEEAYRDSIAYITEHTGPGRYIGPDAYLRLAFASASLGRVYDGQDDYCIEQFRRTYFDSWDSTKEIALFPSAGDHKKSKILSAMAVALKSPAHQAYFELVLKLDPTNDSAGQILIHYDQDQGRYSDLRRIARFMIEHAKDEDSKEFYRKKIVAVAGLADRRKRVKSAVTP